MCVDSPAQHLDHESRREFGHSGSPLAQSLWRRFEQITQSDCTSTSSALDWEESPNAIDLKVLQNALVNGTPTLISKLNCTSLLLKSPSSLARFEGGVSF